MEIHISAIHALGNTYVLEYFRVRYFHGGMPRVWAILTKAANESACIFILHDLVGS